MPHDTMRPKPRQAYAKMVRGWLAKERLRPWCKKHRRKYRTYFSGERDCPLCVEERIADIWQAGGKLREDI